MAKMKEDHNMSTRKHAKDLSKSRSRSKGYKSTVDRPNNEFGFFNSLLKGNSESMANDSAVNQLLAKNARSTNYLSGVEKIYYQIIESNPEIYNENYNCGIRRADVIEQFLTNQRYLKIHDFKPLDFIKEINKISTDNSVDYISLRDFRCLLEKPRESLKPEAVNSFFDNNPIYRGKDNGNHTKTYYYWLLDDESLIHLKRIFDFFDTFETINQEQLVRIDRFIETVFEDQHFKPYLNKWAIYMLPLNRLYTLGHIL